MSSSVDFPTTPEAFEETKQGNAGVADGFVARIDATPESGNPSLLWSTCLGGAATDYSNETAFAPDGGVWVTGRTNPVDFPVQAAIQPTGDSDGRSSAFIAKLFPDGSALAFSTYLGGKADEEGLGIAVDANDDAFVSGTSVSADFPTTPGAYQETSAGFTDAFVVRIDLDCSAPVNYGTAYAGSGGIVPTITSSGGAPHIGNAAFTTQGDNMLGGTRTFLLLGFGQASIPFSGVEILIDLSLPWFLFSLTTTGTPGVAGDGDVSLPAPIPNDPTAVGVEIDCEFLVVDPAGTQGFASTDGLSFVICSGA